MFKLKHIVWKALAIIGISYVILGGFLFDVPKDLPIIEQSIRNIYFHVGMWFAMIFIMFLGFIYSIMYLSENNPIYDRRANACVKTGLIFGVLGLLTGMAWANYTWGAMWVKDPKLNGAAVGVLAYLAYIVLRGSLEDPDKKGRLSAVYNIFAFVIMFVFIMILPRVSGPSIHPGVDGNPALASGDLDASMRKVFYPAIAAWMLFSWWVFSLINRTDRIQSKLEQLKYKNS